jgi:hypothetical protein
MFLQAISPYMIARLPVPVLGTGIYACTAINADIIIM